MKLRSIPSCALALLLIIIFYVLSAPALQVWVFRTHSFTTRRIQTAGSFPDPYDYLPPWTRLIKAYNQPLNWVASKYAWTRPPLQNYNRWLNHTHHRYSRKP